MTIYVDSSALVKMFVDEPGSPEIKQFVSGLISKEDITFVTSAGVSLYYGEMKIRGGKYHVIPRTKSG